MNLLHTHTKSKYWPKKVLFCYLSMRFLCLLLPVIQYCNIAIGQMSKTEETLKRIILWSDRWILYRLLGSKVSAAGNCSHEIKRCLLFGRKTMANLDSILKSRDSTLLTKVCLVKVMVFPVLMYKCKTWTIRKAKYRRIDAFKLWCWRRLLRVPWTSRRSNQSVPKEINSEYSLKGLRLKLKL